MTAAVIDGANVAYDEPSAKGMPRMSNILAVKRAVEEQGYDPLVIVDASLRHKVDDPEQLDGLIDKGEVRQAPAGTEADYFILQIAEDKDAIVVSNDRFRQWREEFPWIEKRRIPVMIVDGHAQLYEPKLEQIET